jgi:hypothetical protein
MLSRTFSPRKPLRSYIFPVTIPIACEKPGFHSLIHFTIARIAMREAAAGARLQRCDDHHVIIRQLVESGGSLQGGRVTIAVNLDVRERLVDVLKLGPGQFHFSRPKVFLQAMQLRRAGNRYDPGLLGEQPCECNLS